MLNNRLSIKTARGLYFANPKKVLTLTEKIYKSYISVAIGSRRAIIIRLIGCAGKAIFLGETADGPLPTLNFGDVRVMRYFPTGLSTCYLIFLSSSYMTCNGTKRAFTQQYLNVLPRLFTMTRMSPPSHYFLQINTGVDGSNILRGKILNLYIECSTLLTINISLVTTSYCLVFKLQGTESCPVNAPTSSISSTTLPTKTTRVTESPAIIQRPHTRTMQQTRAVDNTPKPSYESSTTVLTSLTLKVSSSTEMSNVSSKTSTVLDLQPTLSSSRVSVVTPRAPGSSVVSNTATKKFVIFPTTSNGTPRVEVSSKSSTVSIPPNVGTGRKGDNYGLYIGISTGITASVIVTFIIVVHLSYRHQRLKMRHNQESSARNSSTSMATDRTVDEVTESPNDNSNVDGDYDNAYAVLRTDKREQAIYSSTYSVPVRDCQGSTEESFYDDVMPPKCEPASENNEPIDKELTVVKITQESCHTGSAQSKVLNNTKSREVGRHCYQNYPERPMYINLQELPVNGSLENNSDSKVSYYNLH
ncbi:uncharacterized protein [Montipora capricornis]|uniref:uncharacterized protein isoform X2 n=1 Tax=Montipora capricornis TaxID=246305 RepID=UPI0035F201CE